MDDDETDAFILSYLTENKNMTDEQAEAELARWKQEAATRPKQEKTDQQVEEVKQFLAQKEAEFYAKRGIKK